MENLLKELKNSNENFSSEYADLMKEYYQKIMTQPGTNQNIAGLNQPDEEGGMIIVPKPFSCIKTFDETNQKIFINITSHEKIEPPKEQNILEVNNQFGVRVPMSLSEKTEDFDAKMGVCQVYDAIFNPRVVKESEKDPNLFQFVVNIILDRISQRFNHELSRSFIRMKNFNYKGKTFRPQRVKVRQGPKIEEVLKDEGGTNKDSDFLNNRNMAKEINKQINENAKTPQWNFLIIKNEKLSIPDFGKILANPSLFLNRKFTLKEFEENQKGEFLFFDNSNSNPNHGYGFLYLIELNLLAKSSGINLNIFDDGFILTCSSIYKLLISFPFRVESKNSYSYFDPKHRFIYLFVKFYEDDILKYRNQNSDSNLNEINQEYSEVMMINGEETNIKSADKDKKEAKKIDIKNEISDDYLYDVIV